jgi:hypothetical protein
MNIKEVVNQEIQKYLNESFGYMTLHDVAKVISRMGYDFEVALQLIQNAFREGGDEEVKQTYSDITKGESQIEDISKGKYVFKE